LLPVCPVSYFPYPARILNTNRRLLSAAEEGNQGFVLRWLSVRPEWYLPKFAPDRDQIPWKFGPWSEDTYDKSLVGENKPGVMGPYHPVFGYLTKEEFERLGDRPLKPGDIPRWESR